MTLSPSGLSETDIDGLREEGLGDEEVLAVVMLAGFFQLATSIADALGVELDAQLAGGTAEYESFMTD
jgi:alkylhydroperoxidase family enzyme